MIYEAPLLSGPRDAGGARASAAGTAASNESVPTHHPSGDLQGLGMRALSQAVPSISLFFLQDCLAFLGPLWAPWCLREAGLWSLYWAEA